MHKGIIISGLALLLSGVAPPTHAEESDPEAVALLRHGEQQMRPSASIGVYRIELTRPDWSRAMRFRSHDDLRHDRFRMEILDPRKTRGTLFFKEGERLSIYLPKLGRELHISPVMMHDPWMGSDFNNQDLLEAGSLIEAYTHRIVDREGAGEAQIITIESLPRSESAVVWGKLVQRVRADGLPLQVDFLNGQQKVLRRLKFEDYREMDGRLLPTRWIMTPTEKPGYRTELILEEVQFTEDIPASVFERPGVSRKP
jgi:hypothetical protein